MTQIPSPALTQGVHHVGLSVNDLAATVRFFREVLNYQEVGGKPEYPAVFVSDGHTLLTLWQTDSASSGFNRRQQAGLHHLALKVAESTSLDSLLETLQAYPGVAIEFGPEPIGNSGLSHLICQIPGDIRLELVSHA